MRAGADRLLASVVRVFGAAQAHHGYLFANARATRMKLLVHDGFGVWCAARRLNLGGFEWPRQGSRHATVDVDQRHAGHRNHSRSQAAQSPPPWAGQWMLTVVVPRRNSMRMSAAATGALCWGSVNAMNSPPPCLA